MSNAHIGIVSYTGNTVRVGVKRITEKAVLLEVSDGAFEWFPLTQVRIFSVSAGIILVLPLWLARQKGYRATNVDESSLVMAVRQGRAEELFLLNEDGTINQDHVLMV